MSLELEDIGASSGLRKAMTNRFTTDLMGAQLQRMQTGQGRRQTIGDKVKSKSQDQDEEEEDEVNQEKEFLDDFGDMAEQQAVMAAGAKLEDNMDNYINKYGQVFELPSYYIIDSTIYPRNMKDKEDDKSTWALILVAFGVPGVTTDVDAEAKLGIRTYAIDEEGEDGLTKKAEDLMIDDAYDANIYKNCSILLCKMSEGTLQIKKEVNLDFGRKVKIDFSPCGRFLIMYSIQGLTGTLRVWEIEGADLKAMINEIKTTEPLMVKEINDLKKMKTWKFTDEGDFMLCYGTQSLLVIDLLNGVNMDINEFFSWKIDQQYIQRLRDAVIIQNADYEAGFQIKVACQLNEIKKIIFFEIIEESGDIIQQDKLDSMANVSNLTFFSENELNMIVRISKDFQQAVLLNGTENYLLEQNVETVEEYQQTSLNWLNGKQILFVKSTDSNFVIASCQLYDDDVEIQYTGDRQFKRKIPRSCEPKRITVFDMEFDFEYDPDVKQVNFQKISMVMRRDDEFYGDIIREGEESASYFYTKYRGLYQKWPYLIMQALQTSEQQEEENEDDDINERIFIQINSIYTPMILFRVELPVDEPQSVLPEDIDEDEISGLKKAKMMKNLQIVSSYVTDSGFLFICCETKVGYNMYQFDLDQLESHSGLNDQIQAPVWIFGYTKFDVKRLIAEKTEGLEEEDMTIARPLFSIHVRAPNTRQKIKVNKKLIVLFHHQGCLLAWIRSTKASLEWVTSVNGAKMHKQNDDHIIVRSDKKNQKKDEVTFRLLDITLGFSEYHKEESFTYKQKAFQVSGYAYDYHQRNILLLLQSKKKTGRFNIVQINNVDDNSKQALWKGKVTNQELLGRIRSSLFTFVDGHFYFNNRVIKCRYDLLEKKGIKELEEDQVFDYFQDILLLDESEQIKSKMPLCSLNHHRLLYMAADYKQLSPNKVIVTPFLHERKVFLTRMDTNFEYYYTSISLPNPKNPGFTLTFFVQMDITHQKIQVFSEGGILKKILDFSDIVQNCGMPVSVSENGQVFLFLQSKTMIATVVALYIDIQGQGEIGIKQIKQVDLKNDIEAYAANQSQDNCGKLYLPKEEILNEYARYLDAKNNTLKLAVNNNMDIMAQIKPIKQQVISLQDNLKALGANQDIFKKKMLEKGLVRQTAEQRERELLKQRKSQGQLSPIIYMQKALVGLKNDGSEEQNDVIRIMNILNVNTDVDGGFDDLMNQALFIAEPKQLVSGELTEEEQKDQSKMFGNLFGSGFIDLTMNTKNVFFFNHFHVWYLDINECHQGFKNLKLFISPAEEQTQIKKVRTGSTEDRICVQVKQNEEKDCLILWDLEKDVEIEAFDVSNDPKVFWDCKGDPYITSGNQLMIMNLGVTLSCFDVEKINIEDEKAKAMKKKNLTFGYQYGHRFDHEGHSWVFLRDYISLSYSYMTFVIKKRFDDDEVDYTSEDFVFDLEQYNYLIGCRTALTETKLATADHDRLQYILQKFKEIDPVLLEQIQYYHIEREITSSKLRAVLSQDGGEGQDLNMSLNQSIASQRLESQEISPEHALALSMSISQSQLRQMERSNRKLSKSERIKGIKDVKVTPLYYAFQQRNNRSVKILLQYMAQIDFNASEAVKGILPDLIDYDGFSDYLKMLPFQTIQMQTKQTLRVNEKDLEDIIKLKPAITSYIDREFYANEMLEVKKNEDGGQDAKNYPVKVEAMRSNWIVDSDGKRFFTQILKSEKLEIYTIPAIQMYIEYLYIVVKKEVIKMRLIPYIFQVIIFYALIYIYEAQFETVESLPGNTLELQLKDPNREGISFWAMVFSIANVCLSLYPIYFILLQTKYLKKAIFTNLWAYVDFLGCIGSLYVSTCIFLNCGIQYGRPKTGWQHYRVGAALVCILIMSKSLYFLKLNDKIAPLIFIMIKIIQDIRFFMYVFFIIQFSFMVAFYLIGQVQVDQKPDKKDDIRYASIGGAFQYMWYISIGELSADDNLFEITDSQWTQFILWLLFVLATFLVLIHMLNMLIAVMTETFTVNNENEQATRLKEHLQFVVDNWWTLKRLDQEQGNINYLVAAWAYEEDEEEVEILKELQDEVDEMRETSKDELAQILQEIKKIKSKIAEKNK